MHSGKLSLGLIVSFLLVVCQRQVKANYVTENGRQHWDAKSKEMLQPLSLNRQERTFSSLSNFISRMMFPWFTGIKSCVYPCTIDAFHENNCCPPPSLPTNTCYNCQPHPAYPPVQIFNPSYSINTHQYIDKNCCSVCMRYISLTLPPCYWRSAG